MEDSFKKNPKKRKIHDPQPEEEIKDESKENHEPFSFYSLLNIEKTATIEEIKKTYKTLALKFHPDKNPDSPEEARKNFQKVTEAYQILMDPEKKKIYDETGTIDSNNLDEFMDAYKYFRNLYKKIEKKDIEDFTEKYRFSDMENEDLISFYNEHKGNMTKILECVPLSRNEDIERYLQFFDKMIKEKKLPEYKKYDTTKNKIKKLKDENDEWEDCQKKGDFNSLVLEITNKNKNKNRSNFENYFEQLEKKYAGKKKKKQELNDEEFEEIQKKLDEKKKKNIKKVKN